IENAGPGPGGVGAQCPGSAEGHLSRLAERRSGVVFRQIAFVEDTVSPAQRPSRVWLPGKSDARPPVVIGALAEGMAAGADRAASGKIIRAGHSGNRIGLARVPAREPVRDFAERRLKLPAQA